MSSLPSRRLLLCGAVAGLAVSACGFQLRGQAQAGLDSLYVSAAVPSQVAVAMRRQLSGSNTRLADSAKESDANVRILSESTDKVIQTLTSAGRVFDYQLRLAVGYEATDAAGRPLVEPTSIELQRIISYSESVPLAKESEERLLYDEMRAEAAAQILRRVALLRAGSRP